MIDASEHAADTAHALNEAANTLSELLVSKKEHAHKKEVLEVWLLSAKRGQEAVHRLNVDGGGAVADTMRIAKEFALKAAADILLVLTKSTDAEEAGVCARAYTFYLTAAACATCFEQRWEEEHAPIIDQAGEDYLAFLEGSAAGEAE